MRRYDTRQNGSVPARFVLHAGDVSYADCLGPRWDSYFDMIEPVAKQLPWMVAAGNHEVRGEERGRGREAGRDKTRDKRPEGQGEDTRREKGKAREVNRGVESGRSMGGGNWWLARRVGRAAERRWVAKFGRTGHRGRKREKSVSGCVGRARSCCALTR